MVRRRHRARRSEPVQPTVTLTFTGSAASANSAGNCLWTTSLDDVEFVQLYLVLHAKGAELGLRQICMTIKCRDIDNRQYLILLVI